ncbi:hypothetical protein I5E72_04770 [Proteus terrae]|uniref:hypothetical protein n=1 Tax=Proteus terrae TaxID=1574161 RepID=UPI0018C6329D|nr:hypothetical protein [Proteus terrae]MBG5949052.1 hypothetical protein [Proteus terrae]
MHTIYIKYDLHPSGNVTLKSKKTGDTFWNDEHIGMNTATEVASKTNSWCEKMAREGNTVVWGEPK